MGQQQTTVDRVDVQAVLKEMDDTTAELETSLQLAEQKGWNLLICSIGAELEAFREAKVALLAALSTHEEQEKTAMRKVPAKFGKSREDLLATPPDVRRLNEPPDSLNDGAKSSSQIAPSRSEDEDDEPDPAWLMSS